MAISGWIIHRMRNVSDKSCIKKPKPHFKINKFIHPKSCRLWDNMEECAKAGQATCDNITRDNYGCIHTLRICNAYCSSTTKMVPWTRLNVTSFAHCLAGVLFALSLRAPKINTTDRRLFLAAWHVVTDTAVGWLTGLHSSEDVQISGGILYISEPERDARHFLGELYSGETEGPWADLSRFSLGLLWWEGLQVGGSDLHEALCEKLTVAQLLQLKSN